MYVHARGHAAAQVAEDEFGSVGKTLNAAGATTRTVCVYIVGL